MGRQACHQTHRHPILVDGVQARDGVVRRQEVQDLHLPPHVSAVLLHRGGGVEDCGQQRVSVLPSPHAWRAS